MTFKKKGIGAVISVALLIVVTVITLVAFQNWYQTYSSKIFTQTEIKSVSKSQIENVVESSIYINSEEDNVTLKKIIIDNQTCNLNGMLSKGINKINIINCQIFIEKKGTKTVSIVTNDDVISFKKYFENDVSLGVPLIEINSVNNGEILVTNNGDLNLNLVSFSVEDQICYLDGVLTPGSNTIGFTNCEIEINSSGKKLVKLVAGNTSVQKYIDFILMTIGDYTIFGDGSDGDVIISSDINFNLNTISLSRSYPDGIAYRIIPPNIGNTTIQRYSSSIDFTNGLEVGDEVLVINLRGASNDYSDVGNYEVKTIKSIDNENISFETPLKNNYAGNVATNQFVVIQRIPNYNSVVISSGVTLTTSAWNALGTIHSSGGYYTGIVAFKVKNDLNISGSLDVSNLGYRAGNNYDVCTKVSGSIARGNRGESIANGYLGVTYSNLIGAAGGGNARSGAAGTCYWASGGGGGYGTAGIAGNRKTSYLYYGYGGSSYGSRDLSQIFYGSGGGGGNRHCAGSSATVCGLGGRGGGIIFLYAKDITVESSGSISSNGQRYVQVFGGGGSGGTIYIVSKDLNNKGSITATGGNGYSKGTGAVGRIRVDFKTLNNNGTISPAIGYNESIT